MIMDRSNSRFQSRKVVHYLFVSEPKNVISTDHLRRGLHEWCRWIVMVAGNVFISSTRASTEMHLNEENNGRNLITAAAFLTLAIIVTTSNLATTIPTSATTAMTNNSTNLSLSSSSGLKFSPQPVWEEQITDTGETPINETHIIGTFIGNGTLNLPNKEAINITSYGSVIGSTIDAIGVGEEVIRTVDGTESATQKFFGIARFNMEDGTGRAIVIALVHTNSTGKLAPLDGMILVGTHEQELNTPTAIFRYWEWDSGIPLPTDTSTT